MRTGRKARARKPDAGEADLRSLSNRFTEAWYQLSEEGKNSLMARILAINEGSGAEFPVACDCSWSSGQWSLFGIVEISDIEALQQRSKLLNEADLLRYVERMTVLGARWEPPS